MALRLRMCMVMCSLCGFSAGMPPALTSESLQAAPYPFSYQLTPVDTIFKRNDNYTAPEPMVPDDVSPESSESSYAAPVHTLPQSIYPESRVSNYADPVPSVPDPVDPVHSVPDHVYPEPTLPEHVYSHPTVSNYTVPVVNNTAPDPMMGGYSGGGTDIGQYYYYYPVQTEAPVTNNTNNKMTQMSGEHPLQTHAIIIIMLLVMILLQMTLPGLIASIAPLFPTIVIEGLTIPWPSGLLPALQIDPITVPVPISRDLNENHLLSWENFNKLTLAVRSAIESDECLPRVVCYSARYADGSKALLRLLEEMPSEEYSSYVKMFKDSALGKEDCNLYKCRTLGPKRLKLKKYI